MFLARLKHILQLIREDDGESLVEYERVIIFILITVAAFIYLGVYGVLLSGGALAGATLYLVGAAVLFDLLPEIWLFRHARQQNKPFLKTLQNTHYWLEIISYLLLAAVVFAPLPFSQFMGYSLFLLLWLAAFLIGEAVMILTGRFN